MTMERFVVLGLAPARSEWFRAVAQWATSGALAAEFVKCVSAEEVRARLATGRPFSALVADAALPAVDRDLVAAARAAGCAVLVVDDGRATRDWAALGATVVLAGGFDREALLAALAAHAPKIRRGEAHAAGLSSTTVRPPAWTCPVAALTGSGGTGVSTAAIALAQALGDDARNAGLVLLADLRLRAEQAMLHDARDVVPGVQELAEAHRSGDPSAEAVRALAFSVAERGYHLLLGLRQARHWSAIRPRAFEAAFDSLRRAYRVVVADIDPEFEGEEAGGSIDVEERHVMSRTVAAQADVTFVVGLPTMKGVHGLVRVIGDLTAFGVAADRIVPVVNRAPRTPRARAGLAATIAELTAPVLAPGAPAPALFVPERKVTEALVDGIRLPPVMGAPLAGAFRAVLERAPAARVSDDPRPVQPGSLGTWADWGVAGG
jgi:hypothetical protein